MAEEMTHEKIYCMPCQNDNSALWAAAMKNDSSPAELAALMNGGTNGWMNNPFAYIMFMMLFRGWNGGWGEGSGENYNSRQIAALQDIVNTNHNNDLVIQAINGNRDAMGQLAQTFNTDFNNISTAVCGIKSAIEQVGGQIGYSSESVKNAIAIGDSSIISKMQECCCNNKMLVQQMGYETQLRDQQNTAALTSRIDQLANGIQQGFSQVGYATQQQTRDIINASNSNTQRIIDTMNNHWNTELSQALQDEKFKVSQLTQTQQLLNAINGGCNCNG